MWCENPLDLFRLATVVQNDSDTNHGDFADAAYLFGHTRDMEKSILGAAAELYEHFKVGLLYICELAPGYVYNGSPENPFYADFDGWSKTLSEMGVAKSKIFPITSPLAIPPETKPPISHTGTEAEAFVDLAKNLGFTKVYVVAHPVHILRAFTNTVTFVTRKYPSLRVFAKTGYSCQAWNSECLLNQGVVRGSLIDKAFEAEFERLNKWYAKGDLISCEEVLDYIRQRD